MIPGGLGQHIEEIAVAENGFNFAALQQAFHVLGDPAGDGPPLAEAAENLDAVRRRLGLGQQHMKLVLVYPGGPPPVPVLRHPAPYLVREDQQPDFFQHLSQGLNVEAQQPGIDPDIGTVVKEVEGPGTVQLQGGRHPPGLRLGLFQQLIVEVLENGHTLRGRVRQIGPVDGPHTAVYHRLFHRGQPAPPAHDQLAQGENEIAFEGQRVLVVGVVGVNVHGVDERARRGGGRQPHHLSAQPVHQGVIFPLRVCYDNVVVREGEEHVDDLTLGGEALAAPRSAQEHPVRVFQTLTISHNDVVRKGVHAVVQRRPVHAQLLGHKGNENCRGAGGHTPLYLDGVVPQHQGGGKALLLLPVQPLQGAVVLLGDAGDGKHVVLQLLPGGGDIHHRERQEEHSLVSALEICQERRRVLGVGNEVRGQNFHVVPCPDRLFLLLHFHFVNVGDFALGHFDGLELVHRLNMEGDGHFRVQLQQLQQQLVRQLGGHDLQVGRRAPGLPHPERPGGGEVEAVRGDEVLGPHAGFHNVRPGEAKRLPASGVHLAVKHLQPLPPIEHTGMGPQLFEVAHNIAGHPLQPGAGCLQAVGGDAERDVLGADDPVVAPGNLPFQHIHILAPDAVKVVVGHRDIDLVPAAAPGTVVNERELEREGAVKVVEEAAPAVEDSGLVLAGGHGIIYVLVGDGFGIEALPYPANAVFQHFHIGDGLLCGEGAPTGPCTSGAFGSWVQKRTPPFRRTWHRYSAFGRAWGRGGESGRG